MKISISDGEGFPIYEVHSEECSDVYSEIEIDEATLERWKNMFNAFENMQQEIIDKLNEQGKGDRVWSNHGTFNGFHM